MRHRYVPSLELCLGGQMSKEKSSRLILESSGKIEKVSNTLGGMAKPFENLNM
jgi:hypothetical protein